MKEAPQIKSEISTLIDEWIAGPEKNITLNSMILDFPKHLRLHLNEINDLINSKI